MQFFKNNSSLKVSKFIIDKDEIIFFIIFIVYHDISQEYSSILLMTYLYQKNMNDHFYWSLPF